MNKKFIISSILVFVFYIATCQNTGPAAPEFSSFEPVDAADMVISHHGGSFLYYSDYYSSWTGRWISDSLKLPCRYHDQKNIQFWRQARGSLSESLPDNKRLEELRKIYSQYLKLSTSVMLRIL